MKICEICGEEFQESKVTQRFCRECGKNTKKARKFHQMTQEMLNRHAGVYDTPKKKNCAYCNKEFATFYGAKFCSKTCEEKYRIENAECTFCHTNLYEKGIIIKNTYGGVRFCSDDCKEKYYEQCRAEKSKGTYQKKCEYCGREILGTSSFFCSKECYEKAKKNGWKPERFRKVSVTCELCHKSFQTSVGFPMKRCPECVRELREKQKEKEKLLSQQKKREEEKKAQQKLKEGIEKNGLCFYCQTTHFNCERMRTNFIHYPEGSKVIKGKVVECPSYTEKAPSSRKKKTSK